MVSKDNCVNSYYRQNFYHQTLRDSRGFPVVCRINGKCKTWKTRLDDFRLPVKYGLKECFYITPFNAHEWCLTEEDALLHPIRKSGDWNKYMEKTKEKPTQFICHTCKLTKDIIKNNITTGYGLDKDNNCICYDCCAKDDLQYMKDKGKIVLYLSEKKHQDSSATSFSCDYYEVSNWPGSLKFKAYHFNEGEHNWARKRYNVWFKGPDGFIWYGVQYGDNTQICHCKRTKQKEF